MASALDKVLDYKESYEDKQQELARAEGALKQMMKNLRGHGCRNLQENTDKLDELKTRVMTLETNDINFSSSHIAMAKKTINKIEEKLEAKEEFIRAINTGIEVQTEPQKDVVAELKELDK